MGDVIQFRKKSAPKPTTQKEADADLQIRIDRIKSSIARINALMAELRSTEK